MSAGYHAPSGPAVLPIRGRPTIPRIGWCRREAALANGEHRPGRFGELLAGLLIVALCVVGAVAYGIVHDQVTIRICLEYFTVFHPKVFDTTDPTLLALGWGVLATWWAGVLLGVPLAVAARAGSAPKRSARDLLKPVALLLAAMAAVATVAGIVGRILASTGAIGAVGFAAAEIPAEHHLGFLTDLWIHNGSYLAGFVGGIALAVRTWRHRRRGWTPPAGGGSAPPPGAGRLQGTAALSLGLLFMLVGWAQVGMDEEFIPRFHFPLVTVALGVPAVVLGLLAILARGRPPRAAPLLRNAGTVAALYLLAAFVVQGAAEGGVYDQRFEMNWSTVERRAGPHEWTAVQLEFADHPGWATDIESRELADRLAALGSPRVPVVIRTVRDFGMLRKFKVIRVAEWSSWDWGWKTSLSPLRDGIGPPPFR